MDSTVGLTFRYLESDIVRAMRTHYASRLRLKMDIVVIIAAGALGVYFWRSTDSPWFGASLIILSAVLALMLVAAFGVIPHVAFRRQSKYHDEYSLTFTPEAIHFKTSHIDSELQWGLYNRALIDAHSIILYYGSDQFTVIPKRVFENAEQQAEFQRLISEKIRQVTEEGS
jgi:YcxB-like protein